MGFSLPGVEEGCEVQAFQASDGSYEGISLVSWCAGKVDSVDLQKFDGLR